MKVKNFGQFLNENKNTLPTTDMIEWYKKETKHLEDWDELDRDVEMDKIRNNFFDQFDDDFKDCDKYEIWLNLNY